MKKHFKIKTPQFIKNLSSDDVFGIKIIAGLLGLIGLICFSLYSFENNCKRGQFLIIGIIVIGLLFYRIKSTTKEQVELSFLSIGHFISDAIEAIGNFVKGGVSIVIILLIVGGIIALCCRAFGFVGGGLAGIGAIILVLAIFGSRV